MIEDSRAPILLTHTAIEGEFPASGVQVVCLD